jgi:hypothetical protein
MTYVKFNYVLFIDDVRHPVDVISGASLNRYHVDGHMVVWAKDVDMAKWYVDLYGLPVFIHFDHDLGLSSSGAALDVMDFLYWLRDEAGYCADESPPDFAVHSQNPAGVLNIMAFMATWLKIHQAPERIEGDKLQADEDPLIDDGPWEPDPDENLK